MLYLRWSRQLRPIGIGFDGYVEKAVRVRSTCLVQYDSNRYSVPAQYAGRHISLRAYAGRIVLASKDHSRTQTPVYKEYQLL